MPFTRTSLLSFLRKGRYYLLLVVALGCFLVLYAVLGGGGERYLGGGETLSHWGGKPIPSVSEDQSLRQSQRASLSQLDQLEDELLQSHTPSADKYSGSGSSKTQNTQNTKDYPDSRQIVTGVSGGGYSELFGHYYRYAYDTYKQEQFAKTLHYLKQASLEPLSERQRYQYYSLLGATLWKTEKYPKALQALEEAHALGENAFTHLFMGMIHEILGNETKLIYHYKRSDALSSVNDRSGYEKLGDYYFKKGRYEAALTIYEDLAVLKLPSTVIKISLVNFFLENVAETLGHLSHLPVAGRTRHLDRVYFIQAMSHIRNHDYESAEPYFEKAVNTAFKEERGDYLYHWAQSALAHQYFDRAIDLYQETLVNLTAQDLRYCTALRSLGNAYYIRGYYEKSRILYSRYLVLAGDARLEETHTQTSTQTTTQTTPQTTTQTTTQTLGIEKVNETATVENGTNAAGPGASNPCFKKISEDTRDLLYYLAVSHFNLGETGQAISVLGRLTKEYELSAKLLRAVDYLQAQLYLQAKRYEEAHLALRNFTDNWGHYPEVVYSFLELEIILGKQNFLEQYRQFAEEYESDENFRLILAKYFESIGDYRTVIALLKRYEAASPNLNKKIADIYIKLKEYDVSLEYYNRAIAETGDVVKLAELHNNQAFAYAQLGDIFRAKKMLEKAQSYHPRPVPFTYNLALIEKKLENNAKYQQYLYKARLESDQESDEVLTAMVYFHSSLFAAQAYQIGHARRYLEIAYKMDPANQKIRTLRNGKLLDLFR